MTQNTDLPLVKIVISLTTDRPLGQPLILLTEVDSTNNYAMAKVQAQMAEHGATWLAHHQTNGKGQRDKQWLAEPGSSILMSTVIKPTGLSIDEQFLLSIAIALGCFDFFSTHTEGHIKIKWPNDIYWKDRKAGGILIENLLSGANWKYAIAGIGVNINQTDFAELNAVSLRQITGHGYDCVALANSVLNCLEARWQQLRKGNAEELLEDYNKNLYKLNTDVTCKYNGNTFTVKVRGVSKTGQLLAEADGVLLHLPHGSVDWR